MKLNFSHLFLVVILILLISLTFCNTCMIFHPMTSPTKYSYAPFEPFRQREGLGALGSGTIVPSQASQDSILNTLAPKPIIPSIPDAFVPAPSPAPLFMPNPTIGFPSIFAMNKSSTGTESFSTLASSNYGSEKSIDIFSGTPGSIQCDSISSNLSNSMGGLCLNQQQQTMLRTRGGNASGGDSQIG